MKALFATLFAISAVLAGVSANATDAVTGSRIDSEALMQGTEVATDEEKKTDGEKKADDEEKKTDGEKKTD